MTEIINPFIIKELVSKVELYPHQMNSELYLNLKKNLQKKLEGKCNKYGFIKKIIKIVDYSDGIIDPENFSGNGVYNIRFIASICIPLVKINIIARVENFNRHLILGINGPINAIIKIADINSTMFSLISNEIFIINENRNLEIGDHLIITIDAKKFNPGDNKIGIMASIIDIASKQDIKNYFNSDITDIKIDTIIENDHVEFNEDNDFNEIISGSNLEIKTNYSEI